MAAGSVARQCQRLANRNAKVLVHGASRGIGQDIDGAGDGIGSHRRARSQCFDDDIAKGVGPAGEHEDVGAAIDRRQFVAIAVAHELSFRMRPLQCSTLRTIANDDLGAGNIQIEKVSHTLFGRHAPDIEQMRSGQFVEHGFPGPARIARCSRHATTASGAGNRARPVR